MSVDSLVNSFAIRSFRDQADADYISARMACRAALLSPYLWASQQTIEKYLKCILLLNRIPAKKVMHDLGEAVTKINDSGRLTLDLTPRTQRFIQHLDGFGRYRYLEISNFASGNIVTLDMAVWELRRYCALDATLRQIRLHQGVLAPRICLAGGYLEAIIDEIGNPARKPLLLQNAFFGKRRKRRVKMNGWLKASNAPLFLNPEILDEVLKYVFFPKDLVSGYRAHKRP